MAALTAGGKSFFHVAPIWTAQQQDVKGTAFWHMRALSSLAASDGSPVITKVRALLKSSSGFGPYASRILVLHFLYINASSPVHSVLGFEK